MRTLERDDCIKLDIDGPVAADHSDQVRALRTQGAWRHRQGDVATIPMAVAVPLSLLT